MTRARQTRDVGDAHRELAAFDAWLAGDPEWPAVALDTAAAGR
jgi:hypothetical protein